MTTPSPRLEVLARTDPRLGRHIEHDERSRAFAMDAAAKPPTSLVLHARHVPIFDQGQLGSCTANAGLGMISTGPLWRHGDPAWTEADAVALYGQETKLDSFPGQYPPTDTGSSGLGLCKALKARGLASSYWHGFTLNAVLAKLAVAPVAIGIPWFESMFTPGAQGLLTVDPKSGVAGGHEVCLDGIDPHTRRVRFANSWGTGWGAAGWGWLTYDDLGYLLSQGGDAVTVVR